ncbi:hypothetical protein L208DRAFT_1497592, partial [Tricholoma matsutake]
TPKFFIRSARIEPEITLTVGLKTVDTHAAIDVEALLDSGATGLFINQSLITRNSINTHKLAQPIMVYNIDGTVNHGGTIKEEVTMVLKHQEHQERAVFEVCNLGKTNLIIGCPWLWKHNPEIDWKTGKVQMTCCPKECNVYGRKMKKEKGKRERKNT